MRLLAQVALLLILAFLATPRPTMAAMNHHLICKSVNEVFSDEVADSYMVSNSTRRKNPVQGKPGKRGLPGPRGLKGDDGYVDYNNVSDIVERKVCEGLSAIDGSLNELRMDMKNIQQGLLDLKCGIANLRYNGTCFSAPYLSASRDVNYGSADLACRKQGAKLAEIHDRAHQQILEDFIRPKMPFALNVIYLWTGMRRAGNAILYESGREVPLNHFVWWPGYPRTDSYRKVVLLGVRTTGEDGIWSDKEDYNADGVICEKVI